MLYVMEEQVQHQQQVQVERERFHMTGEEQMRMLYQQEPIQ